MKYLSLIALFIVSPVCISQVISINPPDGSGRSFQLPWNRIIQPAGIQIRFGDASLENHALDAALSPDGKWLAVEERSSIVFISTGDNTVKFVLRNFERLEIRGGKNTYSGITWYNGHNGLEVFWSNADDQGRSYVVSAKWNGKKAEFGRVLEYRTVPPAVTALPNEILIKKESDHVYIYVVLNGNNRVIKQDLSTGQMIWESDPGVAPYGIVMASGKLYITNWAGRHPAGNDPEIAGVPWGSAKVDNKNLGGATREGAVTIIDPATGRIIKELVVGLHPNEIIANKNGSYVYVTNSNSDNVSVIDTKSDEVIETISVRLQPEINPFFGDSPRRIMPVG